ncbi:MAG: DUF4153 domain-containing protein [Bacteroidaceae bacterium]|nr:DUF4153 domain-containing protein [Bacteroidaceae bacterium]
MKLSSAPQAIVKAFRMCVKRFPVSAAYITALSIFLIFNIIDDGDILEDSLIGAVSYYLSVGFVLSLTLHLWQEEGKKQRTILIVNTVTHLILFVDAIYIYHILEDSNSYHYEVWVAHTAVIFSLLLSLFFLSFFKEKDNIASWNFTMNILVNLFICHFIGEVMWGGFSLLLSSFNFLFHIDFDSKWYMVIGVLTGLLLSSWLFLGRIPNGENKHDRTPVDSGFLNAVMRFLFLPLVGLYTIVLYIYAIQILVKWELPNGWVSWLVVASMVGLIIIEFGLYPVRKAQERKADNLIARYLPIAILPLLLLMTVGIIRRFNDYGITINRLYLITLNLWFYFVCITLFITRARRINWITISFALIFLLTSAFPINYFSITRNCMDSKIRKMLYSTDMIRVRKFPLNERQYKHLLHILTKEEAVELNDKMRYMREYFGSHYTDAYVKDTTEVYFYYDFLSDTPSQSTIVENYYIGNGCEDFAIDISEGYEKIFRVYTPTVTVPPNQNIVQLVAEFRGEALDTVFVNLDTLRAHKHSMPAPFPLPCASNHNIYMVTHFSISPLNDSRTNKVESIMVDVTGFVLQKK